MLPARSVNAATREKCLKLLGAAQTRDGGWGPYADAPPEPFDTAVALLALAQWKEQAGVKEMIRRGRGFLTAQQQADGSWPATTRPPGGDSYAQQLSTTGWATLALLETRDCIVAARSQTVSGHRSADMPWPPLMQLT